MNLILYLNPNKLPSTYNGPYNKYPFTQIVNRVIPNKYEPFNVKSVLVNPLDIYNSSYYTFEECVSKSVERFENTNKPLYVKYSGGTDSTLALLSLWNFGSQDLKDRLHLILSVDSIKEFPELFPFIKENFKNKIFYSTNPIKPLLNKGIIITGEFGDQLYGSSMMKKIIDSSNYNDTRILNLPWYEVIPNFIQKNIHSKSKKNTFKMIEDFYPTLEKHPNFSKNISAAEFLWWWNFTHKAQHVLYRDMVFEKFDPIKYNSDYKSFFYTNEFQNWSMNTEIYDKFGKSDKWSDYKKTAKDMISHFSGIENHKFRIKVSSRTKIAKYYKDNKISLNFAIDENWNYILKKNLKKYIRL